MTVALVLACLFQTAFVLFIVGCYTGTLVRQLDDLRLWVLAHDDELDEIAAEEGAAAFADRVRARLRKRGMWTE